MIDDFTRDAYRPYYRDFCGNIRLRNEHGMSLRPSYMFPIGVRGGLMPDLSEAAIHSRDVAQARELIDWLTLLRSEFGDIALEFESDLGKAEQVWKQLTSA